MDGRIMIAAVKSGSGKTTITCALLKHLSMQGYTIQAYKTGPDYIDPMFHEKVLKIPSENLDAFFLNEEELMDFYLERSSSYQVEKENSISVIEGVMGLYDGLGGASEEASSYHVATILKTPIILVVDAHGMGRSIVPLLKGFLDYDKQKLIKGVILNKTSKMFLKTVAPVIEDELGIKVLGCFPKQSEIVLQSRHLGLILPNEIEQLNEQLELAANLLKENVDLDEFISIANQAPRLPQGTESLRRRETKFAEAKKQIGEVRIAIAKDESFCFYYKENLRILEKLGAKLVEFSPLHDEALPNDVYGILLGGGYPELYVEQLSTNKSMKASILQAIEEGMPTLAECGGFMYLHETLVNDRGESYPLVGAVSGETTYLGRLDRFGYSSIVEKKGCFLPEGESIKAHEFHYYTSSEMGDSCIAHKPINGRQWDCINADKSKFLGFPHLYYGSNLEFPIAFMNKCFDYQKKNKKIKKRRN